MNSPAVAGRSAFKERGDDLYESPPEAVCALLKAETLPRIIWERACGPGSIVRVLRGAGHVVHATGLVNYHSPDQDHARRDFLLERSLPAGIDRDQSSVQTRHRVCGARAGSVPACRDAAAARFSRKREPDRDSRWRPPGAGSRLQESVADVASRGLERKQSQQPTPFAWFVWDRNHRGPSELHRLRWETTDRRT
jgi:hypothetical protein